MKHVNNDFRSLPYIDFEYPAVDKKEKKAKQLQYLDLVNVPNWSLPTEIWGNIGCFCNNIGDLHSISLVEKNALTGIRILMEIQPLITSLGQIPKERGLPTYKFLATAQSLVKDPFTGPSTKLGLSKEMTKRLFNFIQELTPTTVKHLHNRYWAITL